MLNQFKKKNEVYFYDESKTDHRGEALNDDQKKAFKWLIDIFRKRKEDLNDYEKAAQKIYTNTIIF